MIKILVPVMIVGLLVIAVLIIHKRQSKVGELKRLRVENNNLNSLIVTIDTAALSDYTVNNSPTSGFILDAIRRHNNKEIR